MFQGLVLLLLFGFMAAGTAEAQTCAGGTSYHEHHVHLGGDISFAKQQSGAHGSISFGNDWIFGGTAVAASREESQPKGSTGLVFVGGLQFGNEDFSVCPLADVEFIDFPDTATEEVRGTAAAVGLRVGLALNAGTLRVTPSIGVYASQLNIKTKDIATGVETEEKINHGAVQVSLGFVGKRVAFGPSVMVPTGIDAPAELRLGVEVNF